MMNNENGWRIQGIAIRYVQNILPFVDVSKLPTLGWCYVDFQINESIINFILCEIKYEYFAYADEYEAMECSDVMR